MFGLSITKDYLRELASCAATDFLETKTPLTEAVVKVASRCEKDLTSEHVRRICEMTYHDAYERMHKSASAADRYISFDPPDAPTAIGMLRAKKVESMHKAANFVGAGPMIDKTANAPRRAKFQAANAFDALMKTASVEEEKVDHRQLRRIRQDLKEAVASVSTEHAGVVVAADLEMGSLIKEAYSSYRDGHSVEEILHACFSGADLSEIPRSASVKVASILSAELARKAVKTAGLGINKTASLGEVDPEHPLPARFMKAAQLETERAHLELTLTDLKRDRDGFRKKVESLYDR